MNTATEALLDLLRGRRAVILCGAGCSTESGIPDYRGTGAPRRRAPVQYQEFIGGESARARYWSRSAVGWPRMRASRPNDAHRALVRLERGGAAAGIITQNVDGLHHAAGSRRVVELHGSLAAVRCLDCGVGTTRDAFQARLLALNAEWAARIGMPASPDARRGAAAAAPTAPDGDAEVPATAVASFRVPACEACGGIMKPDVVFFEPDLFDSPVAATLLGREAHQVALDGHVDRRAQQRRRPAATASTQWRPAASRRRHARRPRTRPRPSVLLSSSVRSSCGNPRCACGPCRPRCSPCCPSRACGVRRYGVNASMLKLAVTPPSNRMLVT
jgi:NAD-dependent SIR2 family protein deacetylase